MESRRKTATIAIIGAGTMGSGLAQLFAQSHCRVQLLDIDEQHLSSAMNSLGRSLHQAEERNLLGRYSANDVLARIQPTTVMKELAGSDLIIEAVFEDLQLKRRLLGQCIEICHDHTILATNTSSFRVADISHGNEEMGRRLIGLHYFFPPARNRLLELIIPKAATNVDPLFIDGLNLATSRVVIRCEDECGFVVNRFFVPWVNEAVRIADEGIASRDEINMISKQEFASPFGAFDIMNHTGIGPVFHAMDTFHKTFGPSYTPAKGLRSLYEHGELWNIDPQFDASAVDHHIRQHVITRLRAAINYPCLQLIENNVCELDDIDVGARVGLQWKHGPLAYWRKHQLPHIRREVQHYLSSMNVDDESYQPPNISTERIERTHWKRPAQTRLHQFPNTTTIELFDPSTLNALSPSIVDELNEQFQGIVDQTSGDTVVFRGTGKSFSAGGDLKFIHSAIATHQFDRVDDFFTLSRSFFESIANSKVRTVALVNGVCMGAGLQLALACDYIVASEQSSFGCPEVQHGLIPGLGGTQRLPRRMGAGFSKYFMLSGNPLSAAQAMSVGLIDALVSPFEWHRVITSDITKRSIVTSALQEPFRSQAAFFDNDEAKVATEYHRSLQRMVADAEPDLIRDLDRLLELAQSDDNERGGREELIILSQRIRSSAVQERIGQYLAGTTKKP